VNQKNLEGMSALMFACKEKCDMEIIKALLRGGADVNAADNEGVTPLMYASCEVSAEHTRICTSYCHPCARVEHNPPCCSQGYVEAVEALLRAGADPTPADAKFGYTALLWASWNGRKEVARRLLAKVGAGGEEQAEQRMLVSLYWLPSHTAAYVGPPHSPRSCTLVRAWISRLGTRRASRQRWRQR
jgi:ankyrin repeat protein